uniref:Uncharacterized protein n=1 Tax=Daphnia magna TaxID=35525 RepID=A0A0P6D6U2_9CRUS
MHRIKRQRATTPPFFFSFSIVGCCSNTTTSIQYVTYVLPGPHAFGKQQALKLLIRTVVCYHMSLLPLSFSSPVSNVL